MVIVDGYFTNIIVNNSINSLKMNLKPACFINRIPLVTKRLLPSPVV
ncbi:hypothetical protein JOC75_000014 [Metabacillus crassostreae]|nr:hypothetical protein [Metabacillus crassostreae]MBM7602044.1 hypothetical protein [Metabacillus crassostreae]